VNGTAIAPMTGWIVLGAFGVFWVALGWYWGRGVKTFDDRVLAGRNVGLALGTATAMATWVTTNTTMTAPEFAYTFGVWGMFGYSLAAIGLILFAPMARRIKRLMPGGYTSGDFIRARYGTVAWAVFLVISLGYALGWLVSMAMAGGILFESLTGIPYRVGMVTITVVCVGYTLLGGMRAVVGTDFIQSLLILIGLVVVGVAAYTTISVEEVHTTLVAERPGLLNLLMPAAIMFLFNQLLFGVGEIFHSNVWWSRAFAFREGVGFRAFLLGGILWLPVPVAAGAIALTAPVLGLNVPSLDMVGPMVIGQLLGSVGAVLILIIVVSSLASSLDSLLAATSDLLVQDVYRRVFRRRARQAELMRATSGIILGLGALAIVLAWGRLATLGMVLNFTGAFVASTIWPIAAGLYWRRTNRHSATAAMVLGSALGLTAYFVIGFFAAALVSAAVSMVCVLAGTLAAPRSFDWAELAAPPDAPGSEEDPR
jgi:urea-proton symporter